ncbi:hypothetical protein L6164_013101 [Bauhinia variegata]|uniref:Uncharacterized protein n=1 Tax=Bauhinia variegata TaxID=167791 RepID=A0ACB9PC20_BAUVA|nr:hypothetical protein L6164_013101 [Bauhinia variegata]
MTTSLSLTSSEQFRLVSLNVPELTDDGIKGQVQQSHKGNGYSKLLRQPHLGMIQKIIKPATVFIDSMLLENKVHENRTLLEFSNPLELNSALSELQQVGYPNFSHYTMEEIAIKAGERLDEINIHHLSMQVLDKFESGIPWDAKAVKVMGSFVIKFVEFLVFLLRGPDTPLSEFESIVVAFKENAVSLAGSQLEKFQNQIDQLNSVIKITLEVTENICDLSLLSDIEYNEDLLSMSVYWAILSVVACYIQIDLLKELGQLALDFSYLVSNLSNMLILLKNQKTICKPQLDEMEAYMMINAFFKETFSNIRKLKDNPTGISEIMKIFLSSKDARQLVIDGSTKSKVSQF